MQKLVEDIKLSCVKVYTPIVEASVLNVVCSIKDACGLALHPMTEETENALEDTMPEEDLLEGVDIT